jgi:hypothetical protein
MSMLDPLKKIRIQAITCNHASLSDIYTNGKGKC